MDFLVGDEFPVCDSHYEHDGSPAISGNVVVWSDGRGGLPYDGNSHIWGRNLTTDTEFPVCGAYEGSGAPLSRATSSSGVTGATTRTAAPMAVTSTARACSPARSSPSAPLPVTSGTRMSRATSLSGPTSVGMAATCHLRLRPHHQDGVLHKSASGAPRISPRLWRHRRVVGLPHGGQVNLWLRHLHARGIRVSPPGTYGQDPEISGKTVVWVGNGIWGRVLP